MMTESMGDFLLEIQRQIKDGASTPKSRQAGAKSLGKGIGAETSNSRSFCTVWSHPRQFRVSGGRDFNFPR